MQTKRPVCDMLLSYYHSEPVAFHMPGHKLGRAFLNRTVNDELDYILQTAGRLDVTELRVTDDLHSPENSIAETMRLTAEVYGASQSFLLVNGSTVGIHAMLFSVLTADDLVIVCRDCHFSVIAALMRIGCRTVFIGPETDDTNGIPLGLTANLLEQAIQLYPECKAVFITRPNYYGVCCDIEKIRKLTESYGVLLLVDEAHGAHLAFCGTDYPVSAMKAGADMAVNSAHKTCFSLTQGAYLHVRDSKFNNKIYNCLGAMETSSPSFLILASLEYGRDYLEREGHEQYELLYKNITAFSSALRTKTNFQVYERAIFEGNDCCDDFSQDLSRMVINCAAAGISGFYTEEFLQQSGIYPEMSDINHVVFIFTCADHEQAFERLLDALINLNNHILSYQIKHTIPAYSAFNNTCVQEVKLLSFPEYLSSADESLCLINGVASNKMVSVYPPGIPLLLPGEIITEEHLTAYSNAVQFGQKIYIR